MPALRKFARRAIERRLRRVLRRAAGAVPGGRERKLHALRKDVKRLRYTVEYFASLLGPGAAEALELLGVVQELLGSIADADAFGRTYAALLDPLEPGDPRRPGLEAKHAEARSRRRKALARLRSLWSGDAGASYPGRLAASISSALGSLSPKSDA